MFLVFLQLWALPAVAATVRGTVTDTTGAPLPDVRVVVRSVASGQEAEAQTGADGHYDVTVPGAGTYLVLATRPAFAEAARTIVVEADDQALDVPVQLELGSFASAVSVTAAIRCRMAGPLTSALPPPGSRRG
jgi:hypothetical protein